MTVKSKIINLSTNAAATQLEGLLEGATFAKGDSWANIM